MTDCNEMEKSMARLALYLHGILYIAFLISDYNLYFLKVENNWSGWNSCS